MAKAQKNLAENLAFPFTESNAAWYTGAMERLLEVVQDLSRAKEVADVTEIVRIAARDLTGADGATFVLRDGDQCYYAEENAISPLWKGRRFPIDICVSGWAMLHAQPVVIEDIYKDPRVPQEAYRPTFVKSLILVPIRREHSIGAIGNYWATCRMPSPEEVAILQALADTTSVALENAQLYADLQANIHVLKKREARIQQQHETLEIFTRALAHDLKEPARTVSSFSDLIAKKSALPDDAAGYFSHIRKAGHRMLMLIESVSLYMRLEDTAALPRDICEMDGVLREAMDNLAQLIAEKKARVTADPLPMLQVARPQLIQLLQNLICNAVMHNDEGRIVHVSADKHGDFWLFRVHDDGAGIDEKQIEQIFRPFKRASHSQAGAGLGLSVCRRIVENYHGKIWCESRSGAGASFCFMFPAAQDVNVIKNAEAA